MSKTSDKYKAWIKHVYQLREQFGFDELQTYRNEIGLLHRDGGPAYISPTTIMHYQNGRKHGIVCDVWGSIQYFFNGILVPKKYIVDPDNLTIEEILNNTNAEVRAVGLRIYGFDRLLAEEKLEVVEIEKSTGFMLLLWNATKMSKTKAVPMDDGESFCLVRVLNSTPELDGTNKVYFLVVPPNMKTVRQAIAWTFYKEENDYCPAQES